MHNVGIIIFLSEGTSVTHARVGDMDYQQKNLTARFAKVYAKDANKKEKRKKELFFDSVIWEF